MIIEILNQSTVMSDSQISPIISAIQKQINEDFSPIWELESIELNFVKIPSNISWQIVILDNSDQAGALGYHELTADGLPLAKIFAKDDIQYNLSVSVTTSHETLEMLIDPWACIASQNQDDGAFYAYEVCDAVEDDSFAYKIDDILVSDFVTPDWFISGKGPDTQFSFKNNVHSAFTLAKGGYIAKCPSNGQWTQITDEKISDMLRAENRGALHKSLGHGRFYKRSIGIKNWKRSTA